MIGAFLWGLFLGSTGGFLVGVFTANPEDPRQAAIRRIVLQVYQEARQAAEAEEQSLWAEYERLTGVHRR